MFPTNQRSKQRPRLRKTKSASEAKELTPNFDWRSLAKDTKSSKQRRELHAGMAEKIPKSVPEEEPIRPNDWLKKSFFEKKQEIKDLELNVEVLRKKIDEQKTEISNGVKDLADLKTTNKHLTEKYDISTRTKFQLEIELKEKQSQLDALTKQNKDYEMKITELETHNSSLQKDSEQYQNEISKLKNDLSTEKLEKTDLCNSLEFKANNLKIEKDNLEKQIEIKTVQIADLFKDLSIEEDKTAAYEKEIEQLKKMNVDLADDLKNFDDQNKDLNKKLNDKTRDYYIIENDYEKLTIDHERVLNLNKEITNKNESLLKRIEMQKNEINDFCQKIESFQSELATIDLAKETLASEKNELLSQLEELEQEFENLSINYENVNTENDSRKIKIDQLTKRLIEQDEVIASNDAKMNEMSHQLCDKSEEISRIEVERMDEQDYSTKAIEDMEAKISKLSNENNVLKMKVSHQEEIMKNLKTENESIICRSNEEIDNLRSENETQVIQISKLRQSLEQVKCDWGLSNEKCEKHKRKENQLTNEIIQLKSKISKLQKDAETNEDKLKDLQSDLDSSNMKCEEQNMAIESHRVNVKLLEETISQLENKANFAEEKSTELKNENSKLTDEIAQSKQAHEQEIEKIIQQKEAEETKFQEKIQQLKSEIEENKKRHHDDMDDIVKNFGDLETELSFCQDELNTKTEELNQLKSELAKVKNEGQIRESALAKELGSLNEQNEMILQNEVNRYKTECEERLREYREKSTKDLTTIHNGFQEKIDYLRAQYENTKAWEIEKIQVMYDDKMRETNKEKEDLTDRIKRLEETIKTNAMKQEEKQTVLIQKSRLIETLTTRIETQQKLIDYMMKALNEERKRRPDSHIMDMLTDIKQTMSEKESKQVAFHPTFSYNRDGQMSRLSSTQSSICTNDSISEVAFSLSPSPVSSPRLPTNKDSLMPTSTSTPSKRAIPLPYHKLSDDQKAMQSLNESEFNDLGYESPGLGNTYQSMYFEDQIKSITQSFQNIENIHPSRENQADMEIWKQKIHFRLKALENQMNQLEHDNVFLNQSNPMIGSGWLALQRSKSDSITYRPSNEQIRALIDTVNQKYQTLSGGGIAV